MTEFGGFMVESKGGTPVQGKALFVGTVYPHLAAFHTPVMKLLQSWACEVHAAAAPDERRKGKVKAVGVTCWDILFARSTTRLRNLCICWKPKAPLAHEHHDLVHTPMAAWLRRLAARRTGQGPVLHTAHGFHFYKCVPWLYWLFYYYPAERLDIRWTDGLIAINGLRAGLEGGFRIWEKPVPRSWGRCGSGTILTQNRQRSLHSRKLVLAE